MLRTDLRCGEQIVNWDFVDIVQASLESRTYPSDVAAINNVQREPVYMWAGDYKFASAFIMHATRPTRTD